MAARVAVKAINDELARLGATARLAKASAYFYFQFGEAVNWLDRTVQVAKVNDLTLEEWIGEYRRLDKVNADIMRGPKAARSGRKLPIKQLSRRCPPGVAVTTE
jgi:hypothetical protein